MHLAKQWNSQSNKTNYSRIQQRSPSRAYGPPITTLLFRVIKLLRRLRPNEARSTVERICTWSVKRGHNNDHSAGDKERRQRNEVVDFMRVQNGRRVSSCLFGVSVKRGVLFFFYYVFMFAAPPPSTFKQGFEVFDVCARARARIHTRTHIVW